jgi:ATP-dependent DNA helicase RecG
MNRALDKLFKYLRLEADRGYDNRAVVGGLERMLTPWEEEARSTGLPDPLIQAVVSRLRDYPRLTPASRQDALRGLAHRLKAEFPEVVPSGPSPAGPDLAPSQVQAAVDGEEPISQAVEALASPEADDADKPTEPDHPEDEEAAEPESPAPPSKSEEKARPRKPGPPPGLDAPLTAIQGIGPKSAKTLEKLGLRTLADLLWHLPRRYDDYSQLKTINRLWYGEEVTIICAVDAIRVRPARAGQLKLVEATVSDGTGALRVTWFNQPWIADRLRPGRAVVLSGKVDQYLGRLTMANPEWEPLERQQLHTLRIVPVYPLTAGVTAKWLRRVISTVVTRLAPRLPDPIPAAVLHSAGLMPLNVALQQIHLPDTQERLAQAQHRLAFDEMFLLQLGVLRQKREWTELSTDPMPASDADLDRFRRALPYGLTPAQQQALADIRSDLASPRPMNRLLEGDVGSGKTVIAAAAAAIVASHGYQSALMAPTSILAEQHHATLLELLPQGSEVAAPDVRLLLGSTPEAEKEQIRQGLADGSILVIVGTHALLEEPVAFARLGLAVIDEQHRFGVDQRAALRAKGGTPNLLVMTATPIPRSLALTVYGDLDLSILDEMPPGRQPIETRLLAPPERMRAYQFIRGQIEAGRQAFIIYPLVEESDKVEAKAAVEEHERLQREIFPSLRLGLLHGRLRPDEKESVMAAFRRGETHILVSTSVVEVGVDIPNASVMLIEGANRFGLAQLHQFRGRVGRGEHKSYCMLMPDSEDESENVRLRAMETTSDGFILAELDLEQRGPGDFLGTRQSGFAALHMARLTDVRLIDKARREAQRLFEQDPELGLPEHEPLARELERFWPSRKGEIS